MLIITYYWPPAAGAGVMRILKFVKYLPNFNWYPIILTVKKGSFPAIDHSLLRDIPMQCEVFKTNSLEPNKLYKQFVGMSKGEKIPDAVLTKQNLGWKKKISHWIRLNLFIPDAKIGWIPFAVKKGKSIISSENPDLIFSTSPPPTVNLIAKKLAKWSGLPWVADFRDPWTNIYYYDKAPKGKLAQGIDQLLEQRALSYCDKITVVNDGFFGKLPPATPSIKKIPNGFDPDDIPDVSQKSRNSKFTIRYMGSMKVRQYVNTFYSVFEEFSQSVGLVKNIKFETIGPVDPYILQRLDRKQISIEFSHLGYIDHREAIKKIATADLLVFIVGQSERAEKVLTSKLFEYIMVERPILGIGPPEGDAGAILSETGLGKMFEYNDYNGLKHYMLENYQKWKRGNPSKKGNQNVIMKYSRLTLTRKLTDAFEEVL